MLTTDMVKEAMEKTGKFKPKIWHGALAGLATGAGLIGLNIMRQRKQGKTKHGIDFSGRGRTSGRTYLPSIWDK